MLTSVEPVQLMKSQVVSSFKFVLPDSGIQNSDKIKYCICFSNFCKKTLTRGAYSKGGAYYQKE